MDFEEQRQEEHAVRQILSKDSGGSKHCVEDAILFHRVRQGVSKTLTKGPMNTTSTLLLTL